jgi:hypothetical protein
MRTTVSRAVVCWTTVVCICAGSVWSTALGQDFHALPYAEGFVVPQGTPADAVAMKLDYVVNRAASLVSDQGETLLPTGTVFDRLEWEGDIGCVYLTAPVEAGSNWIDFERVLALADLVRSAVQLDGLAEGNRIMLRLGLEGEYQPLQSYLPPPPEPAPEEPYVEPDGPGRSVAWSEVGDGQPVAQPMALAGPVLSPPGHSPGSPSSLPPAMAGCTRPVDTGIWSVDLLKV